MKTVTLAALAGLALSADHSYLRNPTRTPIQIDTLIHHKLEHTFLPTHLDDEELRLKKPNYLYKKDYEQIEEDASRYNDYWRRGGSMDDLDENELQVLQTLKNLAQKVKLSRHNLDSYEGDISKTVEFGDTNFKIVKKSIIFSDEELAILQTLKKLPKFTENAPREPLISRDIHFVEDELLAIGRKNTTKPKFSFVDDTKGKRDYIRFDDDELYGPKREAKKELIKFEDDELNAMETGSGSRVGGFSSRQSVLFNDEADNSLFNLGGLVKDGLNIYKDVKSHNYGDLIQHGQDAVGHIKNKNHK